MKSSFLNTLYRSQVEFYIEGEKYYDLYINMINEAKKTIHLQTYIFEMDFFGQKVFDSLIKAKSRGVEVYVLVDAVGSRDFESKYEEELLQAGIYFYRFNDMSYRWFYQWARRLHHKILLIDEKKSLVGGINVTSLSYGKPESSQHLDFAVLLDGSICLNIAKYCIQILNKSSNLKLNISILDNDFSSDNRTSSNIYDVRLSINDWVYRRWQITKLYSNITQLAKKNITIVNSYFFPRRKFMKQLVSSAKRGVKVRLILPKHSDWPTYILATRHLYLYFLRNGVEIYEWEKSILHGKLAIIDGRFSTIGSFNLNYTGYQQNLEMNVDILSDQFTQELDNVIELLIKTGCKKIELDTFEQSTSIYTKCLQFFYYALLSTIAGFSVNLTYQEKEF